MLALPYAPKNKPHSSQIWKTSTGVVVFGECISPVGATLGKRRAGTVFLESELVGACLTRVLRCFSKVIWFELKFLVPVEEISKVGWLGLVL